MKKLVVALILAAISSLSFAGGCWQNGKYVQCPKAFESGSESGVSQR